MPDLEPITREEMLLDGQDLEPITRKEMFIKRIYDKTQVIPEPITREEMFLKKAGDETTDVTIEQLNVSENGTYSEEGVAYSPVIVNVPAPPIPDNAYLLNEVEGLPKDIVTFEDGEDLPMPSLKVGIEPQQDLHGYDSPWVGGAGKNKLPNYNVSDFDNGVIYGSSTYLLLPLKAGTYTISTNAPTGYIWAGISLADYPRVYEGSPHTFTLESDGTIIFGIATDNKQTSLSYKTQIESGSTATSYAPYSNICPIIGWDEVNVARTGKNLFDATNLINDRTIDANGDLSGYGGRVATPDYISVKPNTSICLSYSKNVSQNVVFIYALYKDGTLISRVANNPMGTVIQTENANQIRLAFYDSVSRDNLYNIQLEYGSTPTEYTPYTDSHTYTLDLDGTRYGGKIDLVSGVMTVDRVCKDLGDLSWTKRANGVFTLSGNSLLPDSPNNNFGKICSNYPVNNVFWENMGDFELSTSGGFNSRDITIKDSNYADADATTFKNAMSGVQLVYELATPTTIQLTPTQVKSLLGSNNVWADCGQVLEGQYFSKEE